MTDRDPTPPPGSGPRLSIVSTRRTLWMAALIGAAIVALGVWLVVLKLPGFLGSPAMTPSTGAAGAAVEARKIRATLFYVATSGALLAARTREVPYGATPAEQIRRLVEAEVQPASDGSVSPIPPNTTVRSVFLGTHNEAYVDLGGAIRTGHGGGSLDEALTVYALVNVITVNIPDVSAVQILVDGSQVDTLAGHLDLRYPLGKSLAWVEKGQ